MAFIVALFLQLGGCSLAAGEQPRSAAIREMK